MDKTIELLKESHALLEGHFILSSGKHSDKYVQDVYKRQILSMKK